jgi:hypothetical protein
LNAPDKTRRDQDAKRVVHRLQRDGTDRGPDGLGHGVGRDMGVTGHRPQDSQSLGRDLNTVLAKEISRVNRHAKG